MKTTTRRVPALLGAVTLTLTLAACQDDPEPPNGTDTPTASGTATATADAEVEGVSRDVTFRGSELTVEVGPVVIDGADALVRIVSDVTEGPEVDGNEMYVSRTSNATYGPGIPVTLVDPEAMTARAATQSTSTRTRDIAPGEPVEWFARADAEGLAAGETAVLVSGAGFFDGVPVLESGDAGAFDPREIDLIANQGDWTEPMVAPLEIYTVSWDEGSDTSVDEEQVEVNVSADVLFAVDSADLSAQANDVLGSVVAQLDAYPGGALEIVGHTDDVADDAYNQALSERRAESVRAALDSLTDLSGYEVTTSGKGESEPRVDGTSAEARQMNRRVEILVTPTGGTTTELVGTDAPPPPPAGVEGAGPEGVSVTYDDGAVARFELAEVTRAGGLLLGEVTVTAESGEVGVNGLLGYSSLLGITGSGYGNFTPDALMLLADGNRVAPAQYQLPGVDGRTSLADLLYTTSPLTEGLSQTISIAWPDTGQDTVTAAYEYFTRGGTKALRLTDVPVVEAP